MRVAARDTTAFRDAWNERWAETEKFYFAEVCPESRFDFVNAGI